MKAYYKKDQDWKVPLMDLKMEVLASAPDYEFVDNAVTYWKEAQNATEKKEVSEFKPKTKKTVRKRVKKVIKKEGK